jgi:diguanylate cyclase (GGDEF)-like protein/PAS domain S-box-containing protein
VILENFRVQPATRPDQLGELGVGLLEQLLDLLNAGIIVLDRQKRIIYWNRGAERITGYSAAEALGRQTCPIRTPVPACPWSPACYGVCLNLLVDQPEALQPTRSLVFRRDGGRVPVEYRSEVLVDAAGDELGRVEILNDASSIVALEAANERLLRIASRDHLTGLPNRRTLDGLLDREVDLSERTGSPLSVILVDLDGFKAINDTWGHAVGDESLVQCAAAMANGCRPADVVGRFGGDEFLVLLPGTRLDMAESVAARLSTGLPELPTALILLARPLLTMSLGVAEYWRGEGSAGLLRRVDEALYRAKRAGRNRVESAAAPRLEPPTGSCRLTRESGR